MSYPGNSALGDEVKQRILATFEQSLGLAERGRLEEAALGCDFILELDAQFAPAKRLKERLASGGEVGDLTDLRPAAGGGEAAGAPHSRPLPELLPEQEADSEPFPALAGGRPVEDLFDLDEMELSTGDGLGQGSPSAAAPDAPAAGLGPELARRLAERDFEGVLARAAEARDQVMADPELGRIVETAQARMEARPYVESFLRDAGSALDTGEAARARAALDKARSLDPENPALAELERRARSAGGPAPPGAAPGVSARAPAPPVAPTPAAGPSPGGGEAQGDDRIAELLAEGQRASDAGDYQGAIDAWSRIFLIDVDHEEAARRIEEARRRKAEHEREVEEIFHEGIDALEAGDQETARERFERVVEAQPNHLAAREYLQRMDSGAPVEVTKTSLDDTASLGQLGSFDLSDLATPARPGGEGEELKEEILVPPPPGAARERAAGGAAEAPAGVRGSAVKRDRGRRSFLIIGGAVLVLVLVAAWFVFQNKERFFPNSNAEQETAGPVQPVPDPIERAKSLHDRGQTAMALGQLKRMPPDSPRYAEAQKLIAQWEEPAKKPAQAAETIAPEAAARRNRLLEAANGAFDQQEYLRAQELFDRAGKISQLDGQDLERFQAANQKLEPLSQEIDLFHQGEYEFVLPKLWKLYQADPSNRDVRRLIVDSYYNRGVRDLQRGDTTAAAKEFKEALDVVPDDRPLQRLYLFAQTYERRPKDLLFRIYVKYLPFR